MSSSTVYLSDKSKELKDFVELKRHTFEILSKSLMVRLYLPDIPLAVKTPQKCIGYFEIASAFSRVCFSSFPFILLSLAISLYS